MDTYTPLLEKTGVPQPSLQKFAVISIFSKLRSSPAHLGPDSEPGRDAITHCLHSSSPAVVDQSVRELCCLVHDSKLGLSSGLLELQSALEGSNSKFVTLFVKALGFIVRVGFERFNGSWKFGSTEGHPLVKILSSRIEVHTELVRQVLLFMMHNKRLGMEKVCEFLRPFVNYSILRMPFSDSLSSLFVRQLVSSIASLCCSFPNDALPVFKLLIGSLEYFPHKNSSEHKNIDYVVEYLVDSYVVVLRNLVANGLQLVIEAQMCGMDLLGAGLSLCLSPYRHSGGIQPIVELLKHVLVSQYDLSLQYQSELSSVILSLFAILIDSELEHEQLCVLKFLLFLVHWKSENEYRIGRATYDLREELLLIFPTLNLMSSPSKSVKGASTDLLVVLEKSLVKLLAAPKIEVAMKAVYPPIIGPESIVFRLLKHLWFQDDNLLSGSFFLSLSSICASGIKETDEWPKPWTSQLREFLLCIIDGKKSSKSISESQETLSTEMSLLLGSIASVLVMHPSSGSSAVDTLAAVGMLDPKLGVPLLLAILFYSNLFTRKDFICQNKLPKLLGLLPSIASQSVMIPLVVQTILPMLQKDAKPVLYATSTRLLCQTWEINGRAFGSLQGVLHPKLFADFKSERNICISMAASIRDVCRKDPDRGVDLILSVSACIESQDPIIQALGFHSLAYLCEADVIDFYTAWDVIAKHVLDYSLDPILANSLCLLLRWGAMDAEAYPEASRTVLKILWDVGTTTHLDHEFQWAKARASAFEALNQYEVSNMDKSISDFKKRSLEFIFSETNPDVLRAIEVFQVKIITHEHITRRRFIKEKKAPGSKIEKLLDVFPRVIFSSERKSNIVELPGAALLCLSFTPKDLKNQGASRGLQIVHAGYENALVNIAASLQLSRNIFIALLSLQSWKFFMQRWIKANVLSIDTKAESIMLDRTSKAANDILKTLIQVAEDSIPRSAENVALAVGALCAVLPPSAHTIKSTASKFLLSWLFQHEHEHRQWSAAISLGLISSSLHVTDHKQKFQNITGLMEVLCGSRSILVRGACGIGLGFSCQDLLTWIEAADNSNLDKETYKIEEMELLGRTVKTLSMMICQLAPSSSNILKGLSVHFPEGTGVVNINMTSELSHENVDELEDDIWGVAGLVLGLASFTGVIYRAGEHDVVLKIKELIISWIPRVNSLVENYSSFGERSEIVLSVGSCLALPIIVAFCRRVELMDNKELDHLVHGYNELISELLSVNKSGNFHKSLLMASCVGAGNLLASSLCEGVHFIKVDHVNCLLELFRKCYSNPYPPVIHLGGMLGVVNALGADAGSFINVHPLTSSMHVDYAQKEHSYALGPLFSNRNYEQYLTSLIQEMFLVAQNSDDCRLQQYAAWAMSFLRCHLWSKELLNNDSSIQTDGIGSKSIPQHFSEDNAIMKLGLWLTNIHYSGTDTTAHVATISTVLRCLARAPILPALNWGAIVRGCMRYGAQVARGLQPDSVYKSGNLREECIQFSLAHSNHFDPLLTFLDELSDLSRFKTLELNLQASLLFHLADLTKLFAGSRLEKLFDDMANYLTSVTSYNPDQKILLRISCWNGLYRCLEDASLDSLEYIPNLEKCMEVLFALLPMSQHVAIIGVNQKDLVEEWSAAVRCLGKARREWLLDFLQVSHVDQVEGDAQLSEVLKKIQAKAKLVRIGSCPLTELGKLKAYILNFKSVGVWDVLIEVVAALQCAEVGVKRQWLIDAAEISCVSCYPSTALQFIGLLSGSCCRYMPLLILDQLTILTDLPVTLTSLLSEPGWETVAKSLISSLWVSTERFYDWVTHIAGGQSLPSTQPIDLSENDMAAVLLRVMHRACVCLKDYLPLEKQIRLSNMLVP